MQHVLLKTLANVGSMQYFAWVVMVLLTKLLMALLKGDSNLPLALSLLELLTICLAHLGFTKIQHKRSNASTSMKQEQLISDAATTNISATTSQLALSLR